MSPADTALSPLQTIEHLVQDRAKRDQLDLRDDAGLLQLRRMIDDEIDRWQSDFKRGERPHELADPSSVADRAFRNIAQYGPLTPLLEDDDVWEIMINAPGEVFVKRHTGPSGYHDEVFENNDHVIRTLTKILDDSSASHRKLDPTEGLQDAQLESGARMHIVHGDLSRGGNVMVNIRKFTGVGFTNLQQLVDRDMLTTQVAEFLGAVVRSRSSMIVAGAPGAGKTTLLSCCTAELDPSLRVVVAEEVFETDVPVANVAQMQTRAPRQDRPGIDLRRLVAGFLRMAPDVAIVGEVRDQEALPLLLTLSSGVTGYTTVHAGSSRQALTRLRFLAQLSQATSTMALSALNTLVADCVDVVVHTERTALGPRVSSVLAVEDSLGAADGTQFTVTEVFSNANTSQRLEWTGDLPVRLAERFTRSGLDLRTILGAT